MAYDYSKLKGKIVEKFSNQYTFAEKMDLSERSLSLKLCGKIDWKQSEIMKAILLLGIPKEDIDLYFFNIKVQNI